jgi:uncharacterized protein YjbI with pentapeptide repeats
LADEADWPVCSEPDCRGAPLPTSDRCVAHATAAERATWFAVVSEEGLDARGVRLTNEVVSELVAAGRPEDGGRSVLTKLNFQGATFAGDVFFDMVEFQGYTSFLDATFEGRASFDWAVFTGYAHFAKAKFRDWTSFDGAEFGSGVFQEAVFDDWADFSGTTFDRALFGKAAFNGNVTFSATVWSKADFSGATFGSARSFGPLSSYGQLDLSDCRFAENVELSIGGPKIRFAGAQFQAGGAVRVEFGDLALDDARFLRPTVITGGRRVEPTEEFDDELAEILSEAEVEPAGEETDGDEDEGEADEAPALEETPLESEDDEAVAQAEDGASDDVEVLPRLVSLRGTDVENLSIAQLDLRACRFAGANNLDHLRIGDSVAFAPAPPSRRWTRRQTIAEEHTWRDCVQPDRGWLPPECVTPGWIEEGDQPTPEAIAQLYRALRKGREDIKDEPGAADFYYGEMEMRRHSGRGDQPTVNRGASAGERALIFAYWLVSGYGLRASRALAALLVTVLLFAFLFDGWGLEKAASYRTSLLFAFESTTSLLKGPDRDLTSLGETFWIVLRLLGPIFFGLVLLSLRGRIKR